MKLKYIAGILILLVLGSCEETIVLDLNQTEPKTVIEAQVTNQPGMQFVKLSKSVGFYQTGVTPRITDATVTVEDNEGNVFTFVHNPNAVADSAGYYLPQTPFTGVVGRTYTLTVIAEGETYTASDQLLPVTNITKLEFAVNEDEQEDPKDEGRIYEILLFATEPQDEKNYYLFKFYRNGEFSLYDDTDIYYSDDKLLGESINGVPSPVYYAMGDEATLEMYSLTRDAFIYYNDLNSLLNNDAGGMFGPIPSSPRTNLSNGALGFFQVSAVDISSIVLVE